MAKLVLNDIASGYASITALNDNFALIENALENTLSRDGTTPNQMQSNLDMNGYRIINELASTGDGFVYENDWTTATAYTVNDLVYVPVDTGSSYDGYTLICKVAHTSGTLNTDFAANKWGIIAARGASGFGSGDLVSTNNLSDVANITTARGNLLAAKSGANSDITSLSGLTTPLSAAQGGTGQATVSTATQSFLDSISTTQGTILYNNGTDWVALSPGTSGYFLKTNGAGANPEWATAALTSETSKGTTSGTSVDFTGIPSTVKRITVIFNGVSLSGTSHLLVQVGTGGTPTTSGYVSTGNDLNQSSGTGGASSTAGMLISMNNAPRAFIGHMVFTKISGNIWIASHHGIGSGTTFANVGGGSITLAGTLDMVRITTVNGTDTFDSGSVNIFYE